MDYWHLCKSTIDLVKATGRFIQQESRTFSKEAVQFKGRNDLVTYVDRKSEQRLMEGLQQLLPEAGFMAEEAHKEFQSDKNLNWIIDPLDGTLNFVHRIPTYSISVALMTGEEVKLGVVYEINRDECFYAYDGSNGAFLNDSPIRVSANNEMENALFATGFPYARPELVAFYTGILTELLTHTRGVRRIGSAAVDLCYTAAGRFDCFYEFNLQAWDVAAGSFILQQAGGSVCDFKGGEHFLFGGEIIGGNPPICQAFYQRFQGR